MTLDGDGIEFAPSLPAVERVALQVRTARELCAAPDPAESETQLAGSLVIRGARTIIVADTGHGKTTFAGQLARAVLTGCDVLGYQGAGVGPVLIIDLEQGLRSIKRSLRELSLGDRDDVLIVTAPDGLSLDTDAGDRVELERVIAEHSPVLVILDPYYKAHRGDANEERSVVDLMRYLDGLRARYGFALILPAHPRKDASSNGARRLTLHDVSGSGAIVRGAELVIALERLSHGYARLRILKDRDGDLAVGETWPLIFARGDGFRLDPKEERTAEELEQRIRSDVDGGALRTVKEWAAELGIREKRARQILDPLAEAERIAVVPGSSAGRQHNAKLYGAAPAGWAQQGAATLQLPDAGAAPAAPASLREARGRSSGAAPDSAGAAPRIGEPGFVLRILDPAVGAGHVTEGEALELRRLDAFLQRQA